MTDEDDHDFARRLGARLRAVRVQKRWSLADVQTACHGEFSAAAHETDGSVTRVE